MIAMPWSAEMKIFLDNDAYTSFHTVGKTGSAKVLLTLDFKKYDLGIPEQKARC